MSRRERGAAAVEFAIILPVLFLVVAGIVDFGRFFFVQIQLTNAAREGARAAIVLPNPSAADLTTIRQRALAATAGVPSAAATVVASCSSSPSNATVRVSAPFTWILLGPAVRMVGGSFSGVNGPIVSTGVMRCGG